MAQIIHSVVCRNYKIKSDIFTMIIYVITVMKLFTVNFLVVFAPLKLFSV